MVQPAENRPRNDSSCVDGGAWDRRFQGQRPVRALVVVVADKLSQDGAQVSLVDDNDVVETLGAEGSHDPLADSVRQRASERCSDPGDPQSGETGINAAPVNGVAIVNEMTGLPTPGGRLQELPPDPGGGRARGHIDVHQFSPSMPYEEEDVQGLEPDSLDHEEVGCPDALELVGQEGAPALAVRLPIPPPRQRYRRIERLLTTMPSLSSSPLIRSVPHSRLSRDMVAISSRTSGRRRSRPRRLRDRHVQ